MKENLNYQISFRVTEKEYNRLEDAAGKTNMSVSKYARELVAQGGVVYIDRAKEMLPLVIKLSDLLSNINCGNNYQCACKGVVELWQLLNS